MPKPAQCGDGMPDGPAGTPSTRVLAPHGRYREYSRYLSFHFPFTHERSLLEHLRACPWRWDQGHFKAWRQGRTGYPLVDAGMRELWSTGWMHNRMRVVCASFLVKNLLLPWQVRRCPSRVLLDPHSTSWQLELDVRHPSHHTPPVRLRSLCWALRASPCRAAALRPALGLVFSGTNQPTIPWDCTGATQWGLKHYWDAQLDADLECAALGWQYCSGCLAGGLPL